MEHAVISDPKTVYFFKPFTKAELSTLARNEGHRRNDETNAILWHCTRCIKTDDPFVKQRGVWKSKYMGSGKSQVRNDLQRHERRPAAPRGAQSDAARVGRHSETSAV